MLYLQSPEETVWEQFVAGQRTVGVVDALQRSWQRSLGAGVCTQDPSSSREPTFFGPSALKDRREASAAAWHHVRPVLESLSHQLAQGGFLGVWADTQGVILHRKGGGTFLTTAQRVELLEGANWAEGARGTNAIGTALRESCEVAVVGRAHLQRPNHNLVCYASPVRNPTGELIGVLDVTSRVECAQAMAPAALLAAKRAIEMSLKLAAYERALHGGLEALCQSIEFFPSPAVLLERDGTLRACNRAYERTFGTFLPRAQLYQALEQLESDHVMWVDASGQEHLYRLSVEPVGQDLDMPVAMLVFIEPVITTVKRTPQAIDVSAFEGLYGTDTRFCQALDLAQRFAKSSLPILLLADTGTGKECLAQAIHDLSLRARAPFVPINCGALTESLLEAELFGYADGAFTGAARGGREGKLAMASGGTLFLDEVAELSPSAQAMLLRVLEDGTYFKVGDLATQHTDVRIVAATCRDLPSLVQQGQFRKDLYYRLKGATLTLPKLAEREDIESLARHLLNQLTNQGDTLGFAPCFVHALHTYAWPGNIRELKNALHVAWILRDDDLMLRLSHLPPDIQLALQDTARLPHTTQKAGTKDCAEHHALRDALASAKGNLSQAARILGVARSTLYRMMERHGLR